MDWLDLPAVQGTLKSLLQHHSSKASVLLHSAFFIVQFSHPHMTTGKTLMVFYRLGPGGTGIKKKERKRERKSNIPWVTWKANKAHTQDLYHSRRHRASSQGGLESQGKKVSSVGLHTPKNLLETKEGHGGPKSLVEQGHFISRNACFSKMITQPLKRMKFHQLQ